MISLADKFIEEVGTQEMSPVIYNSSMLVHQSGWHTAKYFAKYYEDKTKYPLLLLMNKDGNTLHLPITKEEMLVKEVFRKYWKDSSFIDKRRIELEKRIEEVDTLMHKDFSYDRLSTSQEETVIENLTILESVTWNMNASVYFSMYFDRKICNDLMNELNIRILPERFEQIWNKAVILPGLSFEKRRQLHFLGLIEKGKNRNEIAEDCQYFYTAYDRVIPTEMVKGKLMEDYGTFTSDTAKDFIQKEIGIVSKRVEENNKWLSSLDESENKIVMFMQSLIELRDMRKDCIMKSVTGFYKVAEKMFQDAGIVEKDLILFVSVDELKRGSKYLRENYSLIVKRRNGISLLVHDDNIQELEYGPTEDNQEIMNIFHKGHFAENTFTNSGEIKGQSGSKGIVRGVARIILDVVDGKKRLGVGEILVTGMTRPEYVPLMKISGGIITDEGGITCHAAIVSRELNKPCVIGTKIATRILKDGNLVEVDANKGIIRIIK
ncbi:MAG: PEP-utilizing enzyme [Candidatus Paceibacterota bacterium]|jgi:phosphoenolpyruvate synthase/pyruvate phosphate dikinase